jgi:hypothetical protein
MSTANSAKISVTHPDAQVSRTVSENPAKTTVLHPSRYRALSDLLESDASFRLLCEAWELLEPRHKRAVVREATQYARIAPKTHDSRLPAVVPGENAWLTSMQVCKLLGFTRDRLAQWDKRGWIAPGQLLGGCVHYSPAAVEQAAELLSLKMRASKRRHSCGDTWPGRGELVASPHNSKDALI